LGYVYVSPDYEVKSPKKNETGIGFTRNLVQTVSVVYWLVYCYPK